MSSPAHELPHYQIEFPDIGSPPLDISAGQVIDLESRRQPPETRSLNNDPEMVRKWMVALSPESVKCVGKVSLADFLKQKGL